MRVLSLVPNVSHCGAFLDLPKRIQNRAWLIILEDTFVTPYPRPVLLADMSIPISTLSRAFRLLDADGTHTFLAELKPIEQSTLDTIALSPLDHFDVLPMKDKPDTLEFMTKSGDGTLAEGIYPLLSNLPVDSQVPTDLEWTTRLPILPIQT